MSFDPQLDDDLEPMHLAGLLAAEREAPPPSDAVQARMWSRLSGSLAVGRSLPLRTIGLAALALGAAGALFWSTTRRTEPASSPVAIAVEAAPPEPATKAEPETAAEPARGSVPEPATPPPAALERTEAPAHRARPRVDTLGIERRLVDAAREALAHGETREAERVLNEHARRFPRGQLREERESLLVRTELTLGRIDEARARAAAFLASDPDSLFAPIVRALDARARGSRAHGPNDG